MIVPCGVGIVLDKEIDPNVSGQPNDHRHKNNQSAHYGYKGGFQGSSDKEIGNHKGGNGKRNTYAIAHIHGTVKEGRFNFVI